MSPLLLVVAFAEGEATKVKLCGPAGDQPIIVVTTVSQAERLARAALAEPSRHAAIRFLVAMLPEIDSDLPGVRNTGLVATHELRSGVPARSDWAQMTQAGKGLLTKGGRQLVESLGFTVEQLGTTASVLAGSDGKRAVAVFLDEGESFDDPGARFQGTSAVSHALALAERESLPWVLLTRHRQVRLYAARPDTGVGRKGRADTYLELNLALLPDDRAGYLPLLFGAKALADQGTLEEILHSSERFAADLAVRLRERVYNECVPRLAEAIAARLDVDGGPTDDDLQHAYEQTLTALFRLLFVAYAEDKDLLPYRTNSKYADHSLKLIARRLGEDVAKGFDGWDDGSIELWEDIKQLWRAVDRGNKSWGVPAYNGGLFSDIANVNRAGAALGAIELTDAELAPALAALLVDTNPSDGVTGPIDFRSLSVREFGTIYEGLLESMLSVASADLTVDSKGTYVPMTSKRDEVYVEAGAIYFHNRSGVRKSTGSYFTKPFAVEYLLDHALERALAAHLDRLRALVNAGDEAAAAATFFDFRCVDLAMGSGHFLTAAVDRIEARLSSFLALHPVPIVLAELDQLRVAAIDALGDLSDGVEIETTSLLRRQVARRCVYGVDLNPISVELARLAVWIHTFVPGLPLSFLDHNLIAGNSLTGIGTLDEVLDVLDPEHDPGAPSLFRSQIEEHLSGASEALRRLATITEATTADVKAARAEHEKALAAVRPASRLFDVLVAARLGEASVPVELSERSIDQVWTRTDAGGSARRLGALHFPAAFPEVFLRDNPGFDVILGNPPWDKVRFEPQQFWVVRSPGLHGLPERQQKKLMERLRQERPEDAVAELAEAELREQLQVIADRGYKMQGRGQHGHHDFAKMFLERAIRLVSPVGSIGYVLPRTSMVLAGWTDLRRALISGHRVEMIQARNRRGWLFDDVHQSLMMILVSRSPGDEEVAIWPAVADLESLRATPGTEPILITRAEIEQLTDKTVIPWFTARDTSALFSKLRDADRLASGDGWVRATADSSRWDFSGSGPHAKFVADSGDGWRVLMTRHVDAFRIAEEDGFVKVVPRPQDLTRLGRGVELVDGAAVLGQTHPPLVFRYPSRNDDSRTLIATALPRSGFLPSKGYEHLVKLLAPATSNDVLALLGLMNSFVCDWWVRRFVDRHVTKQIVDNLPLPAWSQTERASVAAAVAALLSDSGVIDIAGGFRCPPVEGETSRDDSLIAIEVLVARGLRITSSEMRQVFEDFSDAACPLHLRQRILESMRGVL